MSQKISRNTIKLTSSPSIISFASIVGKKEGQGPLATYFDKVNDDTTFGEKTWEKAESKIQKDTVNKALEKANLSTQNIDFLFGGDLLNQCIGSVYGVRELRIPFIGMYGACSTMAESLAMASLFIDNNLATNTAATTSSHFCSAERQFRFPLEYGGQRTPTTQWTVTGAGCCIVSSSNQAPFVKSISFGTIEDLGIKDAANMGAAMAPSAYQTISNYLKDTQTKPSDYDLILTGDLGLVGSRLLKELLMKDNIDIAKQHQDCGLMIFDLEKQDVHSGASGCGCSASVLCSFILDHIKKGIYKEVLFVATGALMSPTSVQQGESIPGIAHLVHLSNSKWGD